MNPDEPIEQRELDQAVDRRHGRIHRAVQGRRVERARTTLQSLVVALPTRFAVAAALDQIDVVVLADHRAR